MTTATDIPAVLADLARHLGDPYDASGPMPFARCLEYDEREEYPHAFVAHLREWGLDDWIVPAAHGGRAVDVQDGFHLFRLVAGRDATAATAMVITSIAYMPVWIAGTPEQRQYFADLVRGGGKMAWGLSERRHGSDVLANEMSARRVEGGWVLDGEKWTIGNATVADVVMVFARTSDKGGPGGYSVFAVEKAALRAGRLEHLRDEPLHGLRGIDMSGIRLRDCFVPDEALIGRAGQGLELSLKAGQFARVSINLIALGCTDTALRTTLDFAVRREIFGTRVADLPYSQRQLVEAFADLLVADAAATGAVRALQLGPAQISITSSVVKYFVPTLLEGTLEQLAVVLGARHWLRDHPRYGIFQKARRDFGVANFADGNTVVNLKNIALQLGQLLTTAVEQAPQVVEEAAARTGRLFDPAHPMEPYRPADQQLFSRGVDDTVVTLPAAVTALRKEAAEAGEDEGLVNRCAQAADDFWAELRRIAAEHGALTAELGRRAGQSAEVFGLAKQYCAVWAGASLVHLYLNGRDDVAPALRSPALLLVCLERLLQRFRPYQRVSGPQETAAVAEILLDRHAAGRLFSFRDLPAVPDKT